MGAVDPQIARINVGNAHINARYERWVRGRGMSYNRFKLLYALAEGGPQTQRALSERTRLIKQTVSNLVAALEAEGCVSLAEGDDRRERVVTLTPEGENLVSETLSGILAIEAEVAELLGEERLAQLADLTEAYDETLASVMEEHENEEGNL